MKNLRKAFLQCFVKTSPNKLSLLLKKAISKCPTSENHLTAILVYLSKILRFRLKNKGPTYLFQRFN